VRRAAFALAALATSTLAGCGAGDGGASAVRLRQPPLAVETRPDTTGRGAMFSFGADDVVTTYGSKGGKFLLHYTTSGANAVPGADADQSGVPDFIEQAADTYDEVVDKYVAMGFLAPLSDEGLADNGGDGRFDVYFVDFAGQGDGHYSDDVCGPKNTEQCAGFMVQENDFKGYGYPSTKIANRILASHEFFHAVQSAYDDKQGAILAEGTATWATEQFDDTLGDFEGQLPGYLENPNRPLDQPQPGAADAFSYGTAIFFEFLDERYQKPLVRTLWEGVVNGAGGVASPKWWDVLDPLLKKEAGASFAEAFADFATWNLFTGKRADPTRAYARGAGFSAVHLEHAKLPFDSDELRVFYASTRYFQALPDGRAQLTAALASPKGAADVDGLSLFVVPDTKSKYGEVTRFKDAMAGVETIDTTGVDDVIVFVVNGAMSGQSKRPTLCIGTVGEVAACRAKVTGAGGAGGAGQGGGGGAGQGGGASQGGAGGAATTSTTTTTSAQPASSTPASDSSSGCAIGRDRDAGSLGAVGLAIGALSAIAARRRRRAR
jgi:hypothetical protein